MLALKPRSDRNITVPALEEELDRCRMIIAALMFEPLTGGVRNPIEALHVLGFPPDATPDFKTLRAKFRLLAAVYHPDCPFGSHSRMSQINQAMQALAGSVLVWASRH